jgi:hypothetical protein
MLISIVGQDPDFAMGKSTGKQRSMVQQDPQKYKSQQDNQQSNQ